jgi:DNA-directed RNA polymerase II subunit RPB2
MERDCMVSHGSSRFLKERLFDVSDCYRVHVCSSCGLFCTANLKELKYSCKTCNSSENICQVRIPYACKLLMQELMGMMIKPRMHLSILR